MESFQNHGMSNTGSSLGSGPTWTTIAKSIPATWSLTTGTMEQTKLITSLMIYKFLRTALEADTQLNSTTMSVSQVSTAWATSTVASKSRKSTITATQLSTGAPTTTKRTETTTSLEFQPKTKSADHESKPH